MPTYESSGSLTTIEKTFDSPQTPDLSNLVYTLNGETISVDVVGSPGDPGEETVTQALGGASSYDLTWNASHTDFEVVFNLSTADTSQSPVVDDLSVVGEPDAPGNLVIDEVADTPSIALAWDASSTADEYRVYRATSPGSTVGDYSQIDTVAAESTTYTDTSVSVETTYYYRVTAFNSSTGESELSRERRARVGDGFTDSVSWDSETEWDYGSLSGDAITPSDSLTITDTQQNREFDITGTYTGPGSLINEYEIRDEPTGTVLASGTDVSSVTETIDIDAHPDIEFYVSCQTVQTAEVQEITITDFTGTTVANASDGSNDGEPVTDTNTVDYTSELPDSGSWTSPEWDFGAVTTATRVGVESTTADASDTISITVRVPGGDTDTVQASGGSESLFVAVAASDVYEVEVSLVAGDAAVGVPSVDSLTLETHTPPDTLMVDNISGVDVDLSWSGVSVADGYQILRATSPGTTVGDYTPLDTTTNTTYTDSSGDAGVDYYYRVRAQYEGE